MRIKEVTIHNWRSIKDMKISFENLMIFIGQNNHGKSNVLSAILFFFNKINLCDLDFFCNNNELFVEILFTDLDVNDKTTFQKYLDSQGEIKIQKKVSKGEKSSYHGYYSVPDLDWLKEINATEYSKAAKLDTVPEFKAIVIGTGQSGRVLKDDIITAQKLYIDQHKEELTFSYILEEQNFLGLTNVGSGLLGDVFFIPAVKDVNEELNIKGKSTFSQLLERVINQMSTNNQAYRAAKEQIGVLIQTLNKQAPGGEINTQRPAELSGLEQRMSEELTNRGASIDIEITPPEIDDVFKLGTNVRVDDGIKTDASRKGNGLQRGLIFALIKSWVNIIKEEMEGVEGEENTGARQKSKSFYFIFEEPELYLHPQAQRVLFESLETLSGLGNQIILSTHSSSFINIEKYKSISIIRKDDVESGSYILQCVNDIFSDVTDKQFFSLAYWINPDRGELFFSKKIILLEGQTDKTVIAYLAKKLSCFKYEYTIIDAGAKDNIKLYVKLLNNFGLKYVCVYDKDHQTWKNPDGQTLDKRNTADISSDAIEQEIDPNLGYSIIFDNDIEEEIGILEKNNKNKPYEALQRINNEAFEISEQLTEKISRIYE